MKFVKTGLAWLATALISAITISVVSSQQVINGLIQVGAKVSWSERASMTIDDLAILQTLFPVMAACFLVGFIVAALCHHFLPGSRAMWFVAAGASSIVCTLLLMSWVMNLMPIAGARELSGMILIALCGALGGFLFTRLTPQDRRYT